MFSSLSKYVASSLENFISVFVDGLEGWFWWSEAQFASVSLSIGHSFTSSLAYNSQRQLSWSSMVGFLRFTEVSNLLTFWIVAVFNTVLQSSLFKLITLSSSHHSSTICALERYEVFSNIKFAVPESISLVSLVAHADWANCELDVLNCKQVPWPSAAIEANYRVADCGWAPRKHAYECSVHLLTGRTHQVNWHLDPIVFWSKKHTPLRSLCVPSPYLLLWTCSQF